MRISSNAYLGVESLVRLASCGEPCTTEQLARSIHRSVSYTEGLMARLRHAGFVRAKRGRSGGYYLDRPPHRISVAEIFQALDEPRTDDGRPLAAPTIRHSDLANLHGTDLLWEALASYILLFLNGVSLDDLLPATDGGLREAEMDSAPSFERDAVAATRH